MNPSQADTLATDEIKDADADRCLVGLPPGVVARELQALDWSFDDAPIQEHAHGLHPYPARFVPELPRQVIRALSLTGDLVLDPFSGGGTSGVEALLAGRSYLGIDANPVGNAIGRAKTEPLSARDLQALRTVEAALLALQPADLAETPSWLPTIPNTDKWFEARIFRALGVARDLVSSIPADTGRDLALLAFVQASARLSFQDSETRYSSRPRPIEVLEVPRAVVAELRRMRRISEDLRGAAEAHATFVDADARNPAAFERHENGVGLIVTSPPYPNSYDYHLYHRFRLFWLGENPADLRRIEIGSHLRNQGLRDPRQTYLDDMSMVLTNCRHALAAGRYAVVVVGDGLFKGEVFETARHLTKAAEDVGFDHVVTFDRLLPSTRRSVTKPGRRLKDEQMVVLRRPTGERAAIVRDPNYQLFPYERDLQRRELAALGGSPMLRADGALAVVPAHSLNRAAFVHAYQPSTGPCAPTFQSLVESVSERSSRRKNSTYFAHGIHRYKGKFYPQLAKSLLNLSGLEPEHGALVLDPFGGSGTVALEAVLNGYDAASIDCNPVATAVARAKTDLATADLRHVRDLLARIRSRVVAAPPSGSETLTQFAAEAEIELARWFPEPVLAKLDWLLGEVRTDPYKLVATLLEVLVSDLIRDVSQQEPRDLRIRRRPVPIADAPVYELFLGRLEGIDSRLLDFSGRADRARLQSGRAVVVEGSSSDSETFGFLRGRRIDAVISSPPYAAALPYVDTDRLSLAAVFGYGAAARRPLERTMIGSREITVRERRRFEHELAAGGDGLPSSTSGFLADFMSAIDGDPDAGFRRQQAPAVLLRYFLAMGAVLGNLAPRMVPGACCWLVLGDSRSTVGGRRWTIPTVDQVAAIAEHRGLRLLDRIPITVTREDALHSRHAITRNEVLQFVA